MPADSNGGSQRPTACTWKACCPGGKSVNVAEIFTPSAVSCRDASPIFTPLAFFRSARAVAAAAIAPTASQPIAIAARPTPRRIGGITRRLLGLPPPLPLPAAGDAPLGGKGAGAGPCEGKRDAPPAAPRRPE